MKLKLDRFHYHEALDRTYVVQNIITEHLLEHPVIQKHKDLKKRVEQAELLLAEVYQLVSNYRYKKFQKQRNHEQ